MGVVLCLCFVVEFTFAIILLRKRERADCFASLCVCCRVAISVLCHFLVVPWFGLWCVIMSFL